MNKLQLLPKYLLNITPHNILIASKLFFRYTFFTPFPTPYPPLSSPLKKKEIYIKKKKFNHDILTYRILQTAHLHNPPTNKKPPNFDSITRR